MLPLLRYAADGQQHSVREAIEELAEQFHFGVDGEGELTLKLDLALDGGVLSLTSSRT
jgi:restriction endonuclease Mrr